MVGTTPVTCPRRPAGPMSTCSIPCSSPSADTLALDQRPCRPAGAKAAPQPDAGPAAALATVDPPASRHRQPPRHPFPSGPMPAGDLAAHRPRRHVDPLRPAGAARHRATPGASARTARRQRRGHQRPVRPDTWTPRTPGHRTPGRWTVRSTGWTDIPTADRTRRTGQRPAWPASGLLATGDTRWAARPSPGSRRRAWRAGWPRLRRPPASPGRHRLAARSEAMAGRADGAGSRSVRIRRRSARVGASPAGSGRRPAGRRRPAVACQRTGPGRPRRRQGPGGSRARRSRSHTAAGRAVAFRR